MLTQQRVCTLLIVLCAAVCGWNPAPAARAVFSGTDQSTITRGGQGIQTPGASTHVGNLKSARSSRHIHNLSPAVLPIGLSAAVLAFGAFEGTAQLGRFVSGSKYADHSRAPPAQI